MRPIAEHSFLLFILVVFNELFLNQSFNQKIVLQRTSSNAAFLSNVQRKHLIICHSKAGSFFHPVPSDSDDDNSNNEETEEDPPITNDAFDFDRNLNDMLKKRSTSMASKPSTIKGVPTSKAKGFAPSKETTPKPYVGIGQPDKPLNDINNPEFDDQGYTLYTNESTGEKSRVFEALVSYPCKFKIKVIGANESSFVEEIVQVVADSCNVNVDNVEYSQRKNGKWISITLHAPVENAEMLYALYENIDKDPRVKFKF